MFSLATRTVTKAAVRRSLVVAAQQHRRTAIASLSTSMNDLWSATGEPMLLHPQQQYAHSAVPRTFRDAMLDQEHAIVVTTAEAPHRIVHVNAAWERLCGFTKHEALHRTLSILQGPDTNVDLAESTVRAVVDQQHINKSIDNNNKDMYLINYRKNGSPFKNHVTIAPCPLELNNGHSVDLLVAVLEEVNTVPLRMVH